MSIKSGCVLYCTVRLPCFFTQEIDKTHHQAEPLLRYVYIIRLSPGNFLHERQILHILSRALPIKFTEQVMFCHNSNISTHYRDAKCK